MPSGSQIAKAILAQVAAFAWVAALAALVLLQQSGVLSAPAVRFFTVLLVVVGIAVPFAAIGVFLYKRSKLDSDVIVHGGCPKCGYDLRGQPDWAQLPSGGAIQCPECGAVVRQSVESPRDRP